MAQGIALRPAVESDNDFLRTLFASIREQELAYLPGGAAARLLFVDSQFNAQAAAYRSSFPQATHDIVELNRLPAGRLYVDRSGDDLLLVDISLLPEYRGRGIGTALLLQLLAEAARGTGMVRLTVSVTNPARRLYERLGFRTISSDGFNLIQAARGTGALAGCPPDAC